MLTARSSGLKKAGPNLDILDENTEHFDVECAVGY